MNCILTGFIQLAVLTAVKLIPGFAGTVDMDVWTGHNRTVAGSAYSKLLRIKMVHVIMGNEKILNFRQIQMMG